MNLKEKFEQYQTDFDPNAWQNFEQLRKQHASLNKTKKNMNGSNVLYIISALLLACLVSVSGIVFFDYLQNSGKTEVANIKKSQETNNSDLLNSKLKITETDNEKQTSEEQLSSSGIFSSKETLTKKDIELAKQRTTVLKNEHQQNIFSSNSKSKKPSYIKENIINNDVNQSDISLKTNQSNQASNPVQINSNSLKEIIDSDKTIKLLSSEIKHSIIDNKFSDKNDPTSFKENILAKTNRQIELSAMETATNLFIKPLVMKVSNNPSSKINNFKKLAKKEVFKEASNHAISPLPLIESILATSNSIIAKPQQLIEVPDVVYNNTFKLNISYIPDYYLYNFIPDANPTKSTGFFIDLDYRRRLSRILSVGIGLGYAHGKDRNNPQLDTTDKATDAHAHLRVHLFFINNPNNKLLFKGGTGLSYTGQSLRYEIDEMTSGIREKNFYYMGYTLEVAYERNISQQLFVGLQVGISSGNDGFPYPGASIGYNF